MGFTNQTSRCTRFSSSLWLLPPQLWPSSLWSWRPPPPPPLVSPPSPHPPPFCPPPPPLAFSLLSVLPRLSALVPLEENPLSLSSANLSPLNATEGWSAMLPPVRCPLMSLTMSSWPPSRELQSRMLISLANLSTSWLPPRPVVNSNPSRSAN